MSYLTINGVTIPVFKDTLREAPDDIGEVLERGLIGNLIRARTGRLRRWTFQTQIKNATTAEAQRRWMEGDGQSWKFANIAATAANSISFLGATNSVAGTVTPATTGGKRDARLTVGSGSQFGVRMQNRLNVQRRTGWSATADGWTLIVWRKFTAPEGTTAAFHHVIMKGAVAFARASAANPVGVKQYLDGVLGSYSLGNCFSVETAASPYVALHGKLNDSTNAAVDFSDYRFLPFEVPDDWPAAIYTEANTRDLSNLPFVNANGDFVRDGPLSVLCIARGINQSTGTLAGVSASTHRVLDVEMFETI